MHVATHKFIEIVNATWYLRSPPDGVTRESSIKFSEVRDYLIREYLHPQSPKATTPGLKYQMHLRMWMIQAWSLHCMFDTSEENPTHLPLTLNHPDHEVAIMQGYADYYRDLFHYLRGAEECAFESGIITGKTHEETLSKAAETFANEAATKARIKAVSQNIAKPTTDASATLNALIRPVPPACRLGKDMSMHDSETMLRHLNATEASQGYTHAERVDLEQLIAQAEPDMLRVRLAPVMNRNPLEPDVSFFNLARSQSLNLFQSIYLQAKKHNVLQSRGNEEQTRILLENEGIPLPDPGTILAWWNRCAIAPAFHINGTPYVAFTLPQLPATNEHRQGGGITNVDSSVSHSLTIRSAKHWRTSSGALYYGEKLAWLARLESGKTWRIMHEVPLSGYERPSHVFKSLSTIFPGITILHESSYLTQLSPRRTAPLLFSLWNDPWIEGNEYPDWNWHTPIETHLGRTRIAHPFQVDDPYRELAKKGFYMRFHQDNPGAIKAWVQAFLDSVATVLDSNIIQMQNHTIASRIESYTHNPDAIIKKTRKGKTHTFDFSGFKAGG